MRQKSIGKFSLFCFYFFKLRIVVLLLLPRADDVGN